MTKAEAKKRFKEIYKNGERILAVQLDGFSHAVVYDTGKNSVVKFDRFSGCMPEGNWSINATKFFDGVGHSSYQNNAQEIVFIEPSKR